MSDRDDLNITDLDAAFDQLTADVDSHTRARGAVRVIRSASRRRLSAVGGAVAVAAMLAGVLVGSLGLPGSQTASPVAAPVSEPLPAPKKFDANTFSDATAGWTKAWSEGVSSVSTELPCLPYTGKLADPEPLDLASTEFRTGPRVGATHTVARYDTPGRATDGYLKQLAFESCQGEFIELPDEIWSGGESVVYGVKFGDKRIYELVVRHQNDVAVLRVAGASELPEDVRKQLVVALLADLRSR